MISSPIDIFASPPYLPSWFETPAARLDGPDGEDLDAEQASPIVQP